MNATVFVLVKWMNRYTKIMFLSLCDYGELKNLVILNLIFKLQIMKNWKTLFASKLRHYLARRFCLFCLQDTKYTAHYSRGKRMVQVALEKQRNAMAGKA